VEHDHLSPPFLEGEPEKPGRRLESERTGPAGCDASSPPLFAAPPALRAPVRLTPPFGRGCAISALPRSVRHWPVAQKQSSHLISDRHRSITGRANQTLESESSKRGDAVLTRSASQRALRGRTSALFAAPPAVPAPARLTPHSRSGLCPPRAARSVRQPWSRSVGSDAAPS
jgi:hypothetical protein